MDRPEREAIHKWLEDELPYAVSKFGPLACPATADERLKADEGEWWRAMVKQYLHRSSILGLENPLGRQALMKSLATLERACESMVRVYGLPPAPGVNSGEVSDWEIGRPDWDTYFFGIARAAAARADCTRARHGAVIVRNRRILSTGYNGSPPGGPSCAAGECPRGRKTTEELAHNAGDYGDCIALHAEQNAIAHSPADLAGATIYITGAPCGMCAKLCAAAGLEVKHL